MRALLDEHLAPAIAALLRQRGHDVQAVAERPDVAGREDAEVFRIATAEGRAVVTNNVKDFRPLAARALAEGREHPGLVLLPSSRSRTRAAVPALTDAIEVVLRDHPDGLPSTDRWVPPLERR